MEATTHKDLYTTLTVFDCIFRFFFFRFLHFLLLSAWRLLVVHCKWILQWAVNKPHYKFCTTPLEHLRAWLLFYMLYKEDCNPQIHQFKIRFLQNIPSLHQILCPAGWGSRIRRLHLCRGVRALLQQVSLIWH